MEKKTIGKFISALRRANGMTQKELGEKLFVSDKTVSRWERDECAPELSLIPAIAEIFGISTDELLRGEKNSKDSDLSEEALLKQMAKSDKQFNLMLHNNKKKFTNLSFISIGLIALGVITAAICNLGFTRGLLGFCLASVFFVAAVISQICFTVSFKLLIDEDETAERIKKANTDMVLTTVKVLFSALAATAFSLPLAIITNRYVGAYSGLAFETWIGYGLLYLILALIVGYTVYKIFILRTLLKTETVYFDDRMLIKYKKEKKHLIKVLTYFVSILAVLLIASYVLFEVIGEDVFIKKHKFDDPDAFIAFVQDDYDRWYEEGYGHLPEDERPSHFYSKKYSEIDGKSYYYNPILYHDIVAVNDDNGAWDILVIRDTDYMNGISTHDAIGTAILALHIINIVGAVVWYTKKVFKKGA